MKALDAGDIIQVDFNPTRGHEQKGRRPAVVLSVQPYNRKTQMVVLAPITNTVRGWSVEVPLPDALNTTGCIRMDNVRALDLGHREWEYLETVPEETLKHCRTILKLILGL